MVQPGYYVGFEVSSRFKDVLDSLKKRFGNIFVRIHKEEGRPVLAILLGSKYFVRVNSEVAIIILLRDEGKTVVLEVIGYAGGTTVTSTTYGAHEAMTKEVHKHLSNHGFDFRVIEKGAID